MGLNPIKFIKDNPVIQPSFWNQIISALMGDFVGRDVQGQPQKGQKLGNSTCPWGELWVDKVIVGDKVLSGDKKESKKQAIFSGTTSNRSLRAQFLKSTSSSIIIDATTPLTYSINGINELILDKSIEIVANYSVVEEELELRKCSIYGEFYTGQEWTRFESPLYLEGIKEEYVNKKIALGILKENKQIGEIVTGYVLKKGEQFILENATRGDFATNRMRLVQNQEAVILNLAWIFIDSNQQGIITLKYPYWNSSKPETQTFPLYWFDLINEEWNTLTTEGQYIKKDLLYLGEAVFGLTGDPIRCKSIDFFKNYSAINTLSLVREDDNIIKNNKIGGMISVYARKINFYSQRLIYSLTENLLADTIYFVYISDEGKLFVDIHPPIEDIDLLRGYYHPIESFRCVANVFTDKNGKFDLIDSSQYNNKNDIAYAYHRISAKEFNDSAEIRRKYDLTTLGARYDESRSQIKKISFARPINVVSDLHKFLKIENNDSVILTPGKYKINIEALSNGIKRSSISLSDSTGPLVKSGVFNDSSAYLECELQFKTLSKIKIEQTVRLSTPESSLISEGVYPEFTYLTAKFEKLGGGK